MSRQGAGIEHTAAFKLLKAVENSRQRPIDPNICREAVAESIRLREAIQDLADKLTLIEADKSFTGIWGFLHAHGYRYTGPNWRDELEGVRDALSEPAQPSDDRERPSPGMPHPDPNK